MVRPQYERKQNEALKQCRNTRRKRISLTYIMHRVHHKERTRPNFCTQKNMFSPFEATLKKMQNAFNQSEQNTYKKNKRSGRAHV